MENPIKTDPRFTQGRKFYIEGDYENAVEFFGQLLEVSAKTHGEMDPKLAPVYYNYGVSLLRQAQNATDVFGSAIKDAQKAKKAADGQAVSTDEEVAAAAAAAEAELDGEGGATEEGVQEDLELAWENLELARVLAPADPSQEGKLLLADVHLALAELSTLNGQYEQGLGEYQSALDVCSALPNQERMAGEVHFQMASAYEYFHASEKEKDANFQGDQQAKALEHYKAVAELLQRRAKVLMGGQGGGQEAAGAGKGEGEEAEGAPSPAAAVADKGKGKGKAAAAAAEEGPGAGGGEGAAGEDLSGLPEEARKEVAEIRELLVEVRETVAAKEQELREGAPSVKDATPQTTIGFGQPPSSESATPAAATLQVKRKAPSTTEAAADGSKGQEENKENVSTLVPKEKVNTMQVKKKVKTTLEEEEGCKTSPPTNKTSVDSTQQEEVKKEEQSVTEKQTASSGTTST